MPIPFNLVVNNVSFGQVSLCILRELYKRKKDISLSLILNQFSLDTEKKDEDFLNWIKEAQSNFLRSHDRKDKAFKLWHLNGGLESISKEQVLLSFYETDEPTQEEINSVQNNEKVLFSCQESVDIFREKGCDNVSYVPLGFDSANFHTIEKDFYEDDRIVFTVLGKFEKRKNHEKVIKSWLKRFGNDKKYALNCAIWNPFLSNEKNNAIAAELLETKRYFNVMFSGYMQTNKQYNEFLNSSHVVLAMSGGEGWGLPEFHSVALGKHAVTLDCSGYKGWANEKNSVLVNPSGKKPIYDGTFFLKGAPWNQGSAYDFNEHAFIVACEEVIERVEKNRVNEAGKKLKEKFKYSSMVDKIIDHLE